MNSLAVPIADITIALLAAAAIAVIAHRRGLLDPGGTLATTVLGPAIVATGGWWLGVVLFALFVTSSLLPRHGGERPSRTWRQVIANGGPALLLATASLLTERDALLAGAAATIAAAAADTWATEIGRALGGTPRSVRTGRRVPAGTSGAVSTAGTLASIAGGAAIAIVALAAAPLSPASTPPGPGIALAIALTGALGGAIDTVLGATAQARFACVACGWRGESGDDHRPGHRMRHTGGARWLTNSGVNLASTLAAGLAATILIAFSN